MPKNVLTFLSLVGIALFLATASLLLQGCDDSDSGGSIITPVDRVIDGSRATDWTIGPIIRGENYSVGMPRNPQPCDGALFCIDLPEGPQAHIHYVTFPHGSLHGKQRIVMKYAILMAPETVIEPRTAPGSPSMLTLYFQRRGDDWSGKGKYEAYRWYATFATKTPITPGEHEIVAPLGENWTAVMSSAATTNPSGFFSALDEAESVGFVLGGGDGFGHGVWATGPAKIVVKEFRVE